MFNNIINIILYKWRASSNRHVHKNVCQVPEFDLLLNLYIYFYNYSYNIIIIYILYFIKK